MTTREQGRPYGPEAVQPHDQEPHDREECGVEYCAASNSVRRRTLCVVEHIVSSIVEHCGSLSTGAVGHFAPSNTVRRRTQLALWTSSFDCQESAATAGGGLGFCARWLDYDVVEVEGMGAVQPRLSAMQLSAQWCGSSGVSLGGGVSRGGSRRCALGSEAL